MRGQPVGDAWDALTRIPALLIGHVANGSGSVSTTPITEASVTRTTP